MTTVEEVIEALNAIHIRTEMVDLSVAPGPEVRGINVHVGEPGQRRYADDTVHPPTIPGTGWVWGDSFQFKLPDDTPAVEIAQRVADTVQVT